MARGIKLELTPERRAAVLSAVREGNFRQDAARVVGASIDKLRSWEHEYPEFAAEMRLAEVESTAALVSVIRRGALDDWRAAAWLLDRRNVNWRSPETKLKARELSRPAAPPIQLTVSPALAADMAGWEPLALTQGTATPAEPLQGNVAQVNGTDDEGEEVDDDDG